MIYLKKYGLISFLLILFFAVACSDDMEDYKKFTEGGEISYTGKIDSLKILSGRNRVQVKGLIISDPKVSEVRVYWNSHKDSVSIPISRTNGTDTISKIISDLEENIYNFEVVTLDDEGNSSIVVNETAQVYGERYQNTLRNQPVSSETLIGPNLTINFAEADRSSGIIGNEIKYPTTSGEQNEVFVPLDSLDFTIHDFQSGEEYTYRSVFLPEPMAIDTFYSGYNSSVPVPEITKPPYFKNAKAPFETDVDGGRWDILSDWVTTDPVMNHDGYGGVDSWNGSVMAMESGWGAPKIVNGKIYQTLVLDPGTYFYTIDFNDGNLDGNGDQVYMSVAEGTALPDVENVETSSNILAFQQLKNVKWSKQTIMFTVDEVMQISIGIEATTQDGYDKFFRINSFELNKVSQAPFIKNYTAPFATSSDGGRWGILENWTTTDPIKNHDGFGGVDYNNNAVMTLESGYGAPDIVNGKIYQTIYMEPGKYTIKISTGDGNTSEPYFVVAQGSELPDFDNVETSEQVLAAEHIDVNYGEKQIEFELSDYTQVTLGVVATMTGDSFKRITSIEIEKN